MLFFLFTDPYLWQWDLFQILQIFWYAAGVFTRKGPTDTCPLVVKGSAPIELVCLVS